MSKNFIVSTIALLVLPLTSKAETPKRMPTSINEAYLCQSSESKKKYYISLGAKPSIVAQDEGGKEFFKADADLIVERNPPEVVNRGKRTIQDTRIFSPGDYMGNVIPMFEVEVTRTASRRKGLHSKIIQIDGKVMYGMFDDPKNSFNDENISCFPVPI